MDTIRVNAACVTGARHLRAARNGQDAAASWVGNDAAAVVVCDGCGSGGSSEVGARLGAQLFLRALVTRMGLLDLEAAFAAARADVARVLEDLLARMAVTRDPLINDIDALGRAIDARGQVTRMHDIDARGGDERAHEIDALCRAVDARGCDARERDRVRAGDFCALVREHFLFTVVAAAVRGGEAAVWVLGDGAYALDGAVTRLGPFADNQPPYLAYDLIGDPAPAHFARTAARSIVIATDGGDELELPRFACERFVTHPDALRRELAVLARAGERIDWEARRVVRTPAALQDDCAIGVVLR